MTMTTNQTIDGALVPRELAKRLAVPMLRTSEYLLDHRDALDELRALLDADKCTSCDGSGEYIDAIGDWRGYCSCAAGVALENKPAAQPQGEPVAALYVSRESFDDEACLGMHGTKYPTPVQDMPLYAEQPRGIAVHVSARWSDWSMVTLEIDGRHRTYVECGKPEKSQGEPVAWMALNSSGFPEKCSPTDPQGFPVFRQAAEQPQGEPVAYLDLEKIQPAGMAYATKMRVNHRQTALYAGQSAPVADHLIERLAARFPDLENMYTAEVFADWLRAELKARSAPLNYGSLDAVQRLAVCRGDVVTPKSKCPTCQGDALFGCDTCMPELEAVVLPVLLTDDYGESNQVIYARGWNACLDELKRLNPSL